jgi:hypothetical protein
MKLCVFNRSTDDSHQSDSYHGETQSETFYMQMDLRNVKNHVTYASCRWFQTTLLDRYTNRKKDHLAYTCRHFDRVDLHMDLLELKTSNQKNTELL